MQTLGGPFCRKFPVLQVAQELALAHVWHFVRESVPHGEQVLAVVSRKAPAVHAVQVTSVVVPPLLRVQVAQLVTVLQALQPEPSAFFTVPALQVVQVVPVVHDSQPAGHAEHTGAVAEAGVATSLKVPAGQAAMH